MRISVHVPRAIGVLVGAALVVPVALAVTAGPVAANCGSDSLRWPRDATQVQGVAFTGRAMTQVSDRPDARPRSVRFLVDRQIEGSVGPLIDVVPWCVAPRMEIGKQYLIATTDTLPLPGSGAERPTPDGGVWFTDRSSVAWEIRDDGTVRLIGYGADTPPAPAWLTAPSTWSEAIAALAVQPTPLPSPPAPDSSPIPVLSPAPASTPTPTTSIPPAESIPVPPAFVPTGAPDAAVTRRGVRLELWLSAAEAAPGDWVQAVVRTTNLRRDRAWSWPGSCASSGTRVEVDLRSVLDQGMAQTGNAARLKQRVLARTRSGSDPFWDERELEDYFGADAANVRAWAECTTATEPVVLRPGATVEERFGWYAATSVQTGPGIRPLQPGTVQVVATWPFVQRGARPAASWSTPPLDPLTVSAPLELTGPGSEAPSLPELVDIALADPTFRAWVDADPSRRSWAGASMHTWQAPYVHNLLLGNLPDAPPMITTVELMRNGAPSRRGIISLDSSTGEVLSVQFLGD